MKKKWILQKEKNVFSNSLLKEILLQRNIETEEQRKKFLNPDLEDLYDPFLFRDMQKAVNIILTAIQQEKKIIVYGDYDVDGITSCSLLIRFFAKKLETKLDFYLPHRVEEGYGLNKKSVKQIADDGYDLIITVDCGITAKKEIELAYELGMEVVVTDHHQPEDELPPASAVINPHRLDSKYPFKYLAGVGVAFKLCQALRSELPAQKQTSFLYNQLDLVALGSVADIVSLKDENRILVKRGLDLFGKTKNIGLQALLDKLSLKKEITTGHLGFVIAPPLNAAGRLKDAASGIELLTSEKKERVQNLAQQLVELNRKRQLEEKETLNQALEMIEQDIDLEKQKGIILASADWHPGVIGIVASRIVEEFYRPTILIALDDGYGKGSCRSIKGLNIHQALKAQEDFLITFGGHSAAAGLEIKREEVADFRSSFNSFLNENLSPKDLVPSLRLDSLISEDMIDLDLYSEIRKLRPFGIGNPAPRFLLNNIELNKIYCVGKEDKHLKIELDNGLQGIGFNMGEICSQLKEEENVDLAGKLSLNEWQGEKSVQLQLEDINLRSDPEYFPVYFRFQKFSVADKRGLNKVDNYIVNLMKSGKKIGVFLNSKKQIDSCFSRLEKITNCFTATDSFNQFCNTREGILFFSNSELKEGSEVDHLLFRSLPFSFSQLEKYIAQFNFKSERCKLHFLYGQDDYYINQKLIKKRLPTDNYLHQFFSCLYEFQNIDQKEKATFLEFKNYFMNQGFSGTKKLINTSLEIGNELDVINYRENIIYFQDVRDNLDFSRSMRYNKTNEIINKFNKFCKFAYDADLFPLIEKLNIKNGD